MIKIKWTITSQDSSVQHSFEFQTSKVPFPMEVLLFTDHPLVDEHSREINEALAPIILEHTKSFRERHEGIVFKIWIQVWRQIH